MRFRSALPLALAVAALSGCPEERADAKRPLPRERLPPAMPIQPRPTMAPVAPPVTREPAGEGAAPAERSQSVPSEQAPTPTASPSPRPGPGRSDAPAR